jgi:hypothetical protein
MCIKNNQEKKYVNGSLGTVIDFELLTDYPIVELKNGRVVTCLRKRGSYEMVTKNEQA